MHKLIAEAFGTAVLVLLGCGAVTVGGFGPAFPMGILPVALAFGLTVMAMIYAIGPISGCHINPAVTIGLVAAGRMTAAEGVGYIVAQFIGGAIGAFALYLILTGRLAPYDLAKDGLGQNGWGPAYLGKFGLVPAFVTEVVATFIFIFVILRATGQHHFGTIAGLVVGLTLVMLHFPFINVTGLSVNPARSLGPALVVGGGALAQVWLFILAPAIGGLLAGLADKATEPGKPA
jgi:aquaporin Z